MATMRITDGVSTIDFDADTISRPKVHDEDKFEVADGNVKRYQWITPVHFWVLGLTYISSSDADIWNGWRENNTELTFYPDYENNPTTSYTVYIENEENPLPDMHGKIFDTYYKGIIKLRRKV